MTQIMAVRSAFPPYRSSQGEITRRIIELADASPSRRAVLERLHANSAVDTRHTVLPLSGYGDIGGVGAVNDRYIDEATALGERALRAAFDAAGVAASDIDLLIVTSVTGVAVPSIDARLIPRLGLRPDVRRLPIFGLGCVAGAAALGRLHDHLVGWPDHTAALLAVEICSLNWRPNATSIADLVVSGLFADGAAALVASGKQRGDKGAQRRLPAVLASRSEVFPDSGDALGWQLGSDGFRIILTAELADVVDRRLGASVTGFLAEHGLSVDEIAAWLCHPGGPKVLDAVQRALKLPDSVMEVSRRSLAEVGNLSSASVLHILEKTVDERPPPPGSFGLMIGLGPGVSAELVLLRW
jgi:alkylresorcinol/alkylpyrone synthase